LFVAGSPLYATVLVAPDYGLKYLRRGVGSGKMQAMAEGIKITRARSSGEASRPI
jgi:hypothetical protein